MSNLRNMLVWCVLITSTVGIVAFQVLYKTTHEHEHGAGCSHHHDHGSCGHNHALSQAQNCGHSHGACSHK